jgi:ankyrin repeat protein
VRILVDKVANINCIDNDGQTPVWRAAHHGSTEIVRILVDKGAKINIPNNYGVTPISCAASRGNDDVVKLLGRPYDLRRSPRLVRKFPL